MFKVLVAGLMAAGGCAPSIVKVGEYQEGPFEVSPPQVMWVYMDPARSKASAQQECDDMGGTLGTDFWRGRTWRVCKGVDY